MKTSVKSAHGTAMYASDNVRVELEVAIPGTWPVKTTKVRFWVDPEMPYSIHVNADNFVYVAHGNKFDDFEIVPQYKHALIVEGDDA